MPANTNINTIVFDKIKEGSISEVVFFSDNAQSPLPAPYVVIKPEADNANKRLVFRFIVHRKFGEQNELDNYILYELKALLSDVKTETGTVRFYSTDEWFSVQTRNDDNTISMERTFFVPIIIA